MKTQTQEEMLDILLRDAFREDIQRRTPALLTEEEMENVPPVTFSPEFERKMEKLIRRARYVEWWQRNRTRVKRLTAMFAVVLLVGGLLVTKADALRIPFFKLLYTAREEYTEIDVGVPDEDPHISEEFAEFLPSYVLEGFELNSIKEYETFCTLSYENKNDSYYSVVFYIAAANGAIDTEKTKVNEQNIKGYPGYITEKDGRTTLLWYPNEHEYIISGSISLEEIFCLIESIEKKF